MSLTIPLPAGLQQCACPEIDPSVLVLVTTTPSALCPLCHRPSRRVHSRYWRTIRDLPCGEQSLTLRVRVRRFFCGNRQCLRRTFSERLTGFALAYAQRTQRLKQAHTHIAQALGSRPGVRLALGLGVPVGASTLLRQERAAPLPAFETPRVLGVDDWAFRRGHHYGTILYDHQRRRVVDLLPDRSTQSLREWLKQHPGVEIVTRDRAEAFADAIRQGAPDAQQVVDRWHLVKNLGQALAHFLDRHRSLLKQAASASDAVTAPDPVTQEEGNTPTANSLALCGVPRRAEEQKQCRRQDRFERFEQAKQLFAGGWTISAIAAHTGLCRKTVQKFVQASVFPERKERAPRRCGLDPYKAYLDTRWQQGCHNAALLGSEIRAQGYGGGDTMLRAYLATLRITPQTADGCLAKPDKLSGSQVVYATLRAQTQRTQGQQRLLEKLLTRWEGFRIASGLTQKFLGLIRQSPRTDQSQALSDWLQEAQASDIAEMRVFTEGLKRDQAAIEAGLSLSWSNGPVEGSNNRLKFVKRRGYGRANFDLLKRRVLQPT